MLSRSLSVSSQVRSSAASLTVLRNYVAESGSHDRYILPVSKVPTYHFQKSLPRLKIPELDATLNKYLTTIQPLVTPEEFEKTKAVVEEFRKGDGPTLHAEVVQQDKINKHTSYISAPWYAMYLEDRSPLPINYNPQITMNDSPIAAKNRQAERTASLISAALKFYSSLKDEVLYPDIFHTKPEMSKTSRFDRIVRFLPQSVSFYGAYLFGAYPLDMSQYSKLFASTRIPKKGGDVLKTNPSPEHVIIMRNNHFYKLIVRNADGSFMSEDQILGGVNAILNDSAPKATSNAVGILSTENRDKWAELREELASTNKENVDAIDGGLFVVSLDEEKIEDPEKLSRLFLFGDGKNRWFDKSFSLVIAGNGKAAVNFEHAWGDGVAVVRFLDEIFATSNASPLVKPSSTFVPPKRLEWNLTPKVLAGIEQATQRFDKDTSSMDLKVLTTDVIKRQQLKDYKVSPDGFLQMSFQLAYAKLYGGKTATTYESASTAAFKHGRTEAIRSATLQSVAFTKAFLNPKATVEEKNELLRKAINNHSKISVEAMTGNGVDRHLFAMRYFAQKKGSVPAIYQDKAYKVLNTNILSTSTLASPAIVLGGFGPVAQEGYGIGYGMDESNLRFNVTSYLKVSPFLEKLEESLSEMQKVLAASPVPQTK